MKSYCYISRVAEILPIEGADKIELAKIKGWQSVVPKGQYKAGELVVFAEIDSLLPRAEWNEFLFRDDKDSYRVRNAKLRGVASQGVVFPVNILGRFWSIGEGDCVMETLGVEKYEKPLPACLAGKVKGDFPTHFLKKTDEDNLMSNPELLNELNTPENNFYGYSVTLKMDGSSGTYLLTPDGEFLVCSRNLSLERDPGNSFWAIADKYDIETKLRLLPVPVAIQGEVCGPGIQNNRAGLDELDFFIFNTKNLQEGNELTYTALQIQQEVLGIPVVPQVDIITGELTLDMLQEIANNVTYPNGKAAEGIVVRPIMGGISKSLGKPLSVKVINQNYKD